MTRNVSSLIKPEFLTDSTIGYYSINLELSLGTRLGPDMEVTTYCATSNYGPFKDSDDSLLVETKRFSDPQEGGNE